MNNRYEDLGDTLKAILGNSNVYYRPGSNITMGYPAIRYNRERIDTSFADNKPYFNKMRYEIIYISRIADDDVIEGILAIPYCTHNRQYIANNLNHEVFTVYY